MRVGLASSTGCALAMILVTGCIQPFDGSHVEMLLGDAVLTPCEVISKYASTLKTKGITPTVACTKDRAKDRFLYHYELWGTVKKSVIVRLASFTVQHHLINDPTAPKDYTKYELFQLETAGVTLSTGRPLKIGFEKYFSEMTETEQTEAKERMLLIAPILSVTSFTTKMYSDEANKVLDKSFFLGFQSQITRPFNGKYFGAVYSSNPFGTGYIGGAELVVDARLDDLDSLWITIESDDPDRSNPTPSKLIYLTGTAEQTVRGTINVDAVSPWDTKATASFGVLTDLADEDYF
jgi:hypothetical protein